MENCICIRFYEIAMLPSFARSAHVVPDSTQQGGRDLILAVHQARRARDLIGNTPVGAHSEPGVCNLPCVKIASYGQ